MGEAKRRQQQDPNYGKVKRKPVAKNKLKKKIFDTSKLSKTELVIWAVLLGAAVATFLLSFQGQPPA
ncbi:MAG: hypothetical protein AAF152_10715 [Cyanobacteria bacterium P01_A01_bin.114]